MFGGGQPCRNPLRINGQTLPARNREGSALNPWEKIANIMDSTCIEGQLVELSGDSTILIPSSG